MTPGRIAELRWEAEHLRGRDMPETARSINEALDEIERLQQIINDCSLTHCETEDKLQQIQRERDALLREHDCYYFLMLDDFAVLTTTFPSLRGAHDEASRVLAEGAKK